MVAADQCDVLWVAHFQGKEEEEGLYGVEASIDEIPHEEVVGAGAVVAYPEKLH